MTPRAIANRLLEADEDFDVHGELERLSTTYPGYEIESEGNHWNVYKHTPGFTSFGQGHQRYQQSHIGTVTYDDMSTMPRETMTPEQQAHWDAHHWMASAGFRDDEQKFCKTFEEAVQFVIGKHTVRESADPDDPGANVERFATDRSKPVAKFITNHEGREFKVRIVWDKAAGGTTYDGAGKVVPEKLQPTVEFYDLTNNKEGYFVSSYFAATLVDRQPHTGINLYGSEPAWQIDWKAMDDLVPWIKQEVESRGYKLTKNNPGGVSFGWTYESEDDPESYVHPERFTGQPSEEKIEGTLRRMLAPYYTTVTVNKRPGLFAGRGITQRNIPGQPGIEHKITIHDSFIWTIHCHRDLPLPLPKTHGALEYVEKLDWRKEAESWFKKWAAESGLSLFKFKIAGRLRINPTFQFETARMGPLKENEDEMSPEAILASHIDKDAAQEELLAALWKFHPYGTGYNALLGPRGGFVMVTLYFPPEKDDFYKRFEEFAVNWITEHKLFQINSTKLTGGKHPNSEPYPRWSLTLALNTDWPPDSPPYVPPPVEVGQPGASVA